MPDIYSVRLTKSKSCFYTKNGKRIALANIKEPHRAKLQKRCLELKASARKNKDCYPTVAQLKRTAKDRGIKFESGTRKILMCNRLGLPSTAKKSARPCPVGAKGMCIYISPYTKWNVLLYNYLKNLECGSHRYISIKTDRIGDRSDTYIRISFYCGARPRSCRDPTLQKRCNVWGDINCTPRFAGSLLYKTNCLDRHNKVYQGRETPKAHRYYVKGYDNFYEYVQAVKAGRISLNDNTQLFTLLFKTYGTMYARYDVNLESGVIREGGDEHRGILSFEYR